MNKLMITFKDVVHKEVGKYGHRDWINESWGNKRKYETVLIPEVMLWGRKVLSITVKCLCTLCKYRAWMHTQNQTTQSAFSAFIHYLWRTMCFDSNAFMA